MVREFIKGESVSVDSCIGLLRMTQSQHMSFLLTRVVSLESGIDMPRVDFSDTVNKDALVGHRWHSP